MLRRTSYAHVVIREDGVPIIEGKGFEVHKLAREREASGLRPDELLTLHPELKESEVWSGLAYCVDNPGGGDEHVQQEGLTDQEIYDWPGDDFLERYRRSEGLELLEAYQDDANEDLFAAA